MTTPYLAPAGAPCWADLWTSDPEGSRRFYSELFGWQAGEADPSHGGYFMFTRDGAPVAGGMGSMGDLQANDTWKPYLSVPDIAKTVEATRQAGGEVAFPPMAVDDLGSQAVLVDPTGATVGAWQPGTFAGFSVLGEPGAPSWFELHTRDHDAAVAFYTAAFGWKTRPLAGDHPMRYTTLHDEAGDRELAGILDAAGFLPPGAPSRWTIYWGVADADAVVEKATALGGSVVQGAEDTPFGRIATVRDPAGAELKLHAPLAR